MTLPKQPPSSSNRQPAGAAESTGGRFAPNLRSEGTSSADDQQRTASDRSHARVAVAAAVLPTIRAQIAADRMIAAFELSASNSGHLEVKALDGAGNEIPGSRNDIAYQLEQQGGVQADLILVDGATESLAPGAITDWKYQAEESAAVDAVAEDEAKPARPVRPTPPDFLRADDAAEARRAAQVANIKEATKRFRKPGEPLT